ncbi:MAG: hypothetical protein KC917_19945, partial [Candidatus Omnitrophica bacterium]|nr:hypothetical protein [Candidatus Omnitrophota bacterium]
LEPGDSFRVTDDDGRFFRSEAGSPVESSVEDSEHVVGSELAVADPLGGQQTDNLNGFSNQNEVELLGFRLVGSVTQVDSIEFGLTNVVDIGPENFTSISLFIDGNANGRVDGFDTRVGGTGTVEVMNGFGTLSFAEPIAINQSFLLSASFRRLTGASQLTVTLSPGNVLAGEIPATGSEQNASHSVDDPYTLSLSNGWVPAANFGETVNQSDFLLLAFRILPVGRTVDALEVTLSGVLGIEPGDIQNVRLYEDVNVNNRFDGSDLLIDAADTIEVDENSGRIVFSDSFSTVSNILLVGDFSNLANRDEMTLSISAAGLQVPFGFMAGGVVQPVRYEVGAGLIDNRGKNQRWTLDYRSPGGTTANGRFNNAGNRVILGYDTGSAWVYDFDSNTPLLMLKDHFDRVEYAGFNFDDSAAITVTRDGAVLIWDSQTGEQVSALFSDILVTTAV